MKISNCSNKSRKLNRTISTTVVIWNSSMKNWENYYFIYLEEG